MKKLLYILLFIPSLAFGTDYYVATTGNDGNAGTIGSPFKTLNKAWSVVAAGETIYMRGGKYTYAIIGETVLSGKSGTNGNMIKIYNYPGESPVIDFSDHTYSAGTGGQGIRLNNANYIHMKGIRLTQVRQVNEADPYPAYGILLESYSSNTINNCIFEDIEVDHIGGQGIVIANNCSNNLFLNCDSHHNADPYSVSHYGNGDGFECGAANSANNIFRGCRAWHNSDDGFDFRLNNGLVTLDSCWAFRNGYIPDSWSTGGNGVGFKIGQIQTAHTANVVRILTNCVAFDNRSIAFHHSPDGVNYDGSARIYNCIAYSNPNQGFNIQTLTTATDIVRNNIAYGNGSESEEAETSDHNSWSGGFTVTDADFVSVDTTGVCGARQSNGTLPELDFLKLASTSDLRDAGVYVGIDFEGTSPDIGAYEYADPPVVPSGVTFKKIGSKFVKVNGKLGR